MTWPERQVRRWRSHPRCKTSSRLWRQILFPFLPNLSGSQQIRPRPNCENIKLNKIDPDGVVTLRILCRFVFGSIHEWRYILKDDFVAKRRKWNFSNLINAIKMCFENLSCHFSTWLENVGYFYLHYRWWASCFATFRSWRPVTRCSSWSSIAPRSSWWACPWSIGWTFCWLGWPFDQRNGRNPWSWRAWPIPDLWQPGLELRTVHKYRQSFHWDILCRYDPWSWGRQFFRLTFAKFLCLTMESIRVPQRFIWTGNMRTFASSIGKQLQ